MTDTKKSTQKTKRKRQCTACRQMKEKQDLVRVVRTPEGAVICDAGGRMNGRGAYLCRDAECLKKARKNASLERALKVRIPDEVYDQIEEVINS